MRKSRLLVLGNWCFRWWAGFHVCSAHMFLYHRSRKTSWSLLNCTKSFSDTTDCTIQNWETRTVLQHNRQVVYSPALRNTLNEILKLCRHRKLWCFWSRETGKTAEHVLLPSLAKVKQTANVHQIGNRTVQRSTAFSGRVKSYFCNTIPWLVVSI